MRPVVSDELQSNRQAEDGTGSEIAGWPVMLNGCVCFSIAARTAVRVAERRIDRDLVAAEKRRGDWHRWQDERIGSVEQRVDVRAKPAAELQARTYFTAGIDRPLSNRARTIGV